MIERSPEAQAEWERLKRIEAERDAITEREAEAKWIAWQQFKEQNPTWKHVAHDRTPRDFALIKDLERRGLVRRDAKGTAKLMSSELAKNMKKLDKERAKKFVEEHWHECEEILLRLARSDDERIAMEGLKMMIYLGIGRPGVSDPPKDDDDRRVLVSSKLPDVGDEE